MEITVRITRKHAALAALIPTLILSMLLVNAFGGNNPAVVGHSALELIVNGSSVVDDSLTGDDIDESTLVLPGSSLDGAVIIVTPGNETTIQNAIDNLSSLGGGTVYMREGTYTIAGPINLTSNIALVGEGSASILQATTNGITLITDQSASLVNNVRLKDFAIRAGSATGLNGISFSDVWGLIEGIDIKGIQGISIFVGNDGVTPAEPMTMLITRNTIETGSSSNAIRVDGGSPSTQSQVSITHNSIESNATRVIQTNEVQVAYNTIRSVSGTTGIHASASEVIGNRIIANSGVPIEAAGSNNIVSHNDIDGAGNQAILVSSSGVNTVSANNINAWSLNSGSHAAIHYQSNSDGAITGNIIDGSGVGSVGINVSGSGAVAVTGNYIFPDIIAIWIEGINSVITGNQAQGDIFVTANDVTIDGNTLDQGGINVTSIARFAVTGNKINGYLDATGSSTCALTGNIVDGTLFVGACSASNNI